MKLEEKIYYAVLDLLSNSEEINVSSLARKVGISRQNLQYYIRKQKDFIDVEVA
jgi:predicted nucleic-acid-binding protein